LKKNLAIDFGLKVDKYPEMVDDTVNALNAQEANLPSHLKKGKLQNGFSFAQNGNDKVVAGKNGKIVDHIQCHKCKATRYYASQCPGGDDDARKDPDSQVCMCIELTTISSGSLDPALILLDSQSTVHVFINKDLLNNIGKHPDGNVLRIYTNGGYMDSEMLGHFGDIDVWYNPKSIANILSLALVIKLYHVCLDSSFAATFTLSLDDMAYIKFTEFNQCFVFNSRDHPVFTCSKSPQHHFSLLQTVDTNESMYRNCEIESARLALDIGRSLLLLGLGLGLGLRSVTFQEDRGWNLLENTKKSV
jgi:hypothetical protein